MTNQKPFQGPAEDLFNIGQWADKGGKGRGQLNAFSSESVVSESNDRNVLTGASCRPEIQCMHWLSKTPDEPILAYGQRGCCRNAQRT